MKRAGHMLRAVVSFGVLFLSVHGFCAEAPVDIGVLTPFYRNMQLQGHLFGMGLMEIPDYVLAADIDFRYQKKPGMKLEIPFVDSFTINRFLGGYREDWLKKFNLWDDQLGVRSIDYVIRKGDGTLQFRPELIQRRIAPYIDAGYSPANITIALENVPWDIAASPESGAWGQKSPPANQQEWREVISHFASDLKDYLGASASAVSFKTGVEYDTKASFHGNASDFFAYYEATDQGLHSVLPSAALSSGEFTGIGECPTQVTTCVYATSDFIRVALTRHLSLSDVPRSLNSFLNRGNPMPSAAVTRAVESYSRLPPHTVVEIHQFGLLNQPFGAEDGKNPGALEANFEFQALMGLWEKLKPRRVFHWGGFVEAGDLKFLNGSGLLRLVLDHYVGYRAARLSPEEAGRNRVFARTELMAVEFKNSTTSALIISSFNPTMDLGKRTIRVDLPTTPRSRSAKTIRYRNSDNVFSAIRSDLANEHNLKHEFSNCSSCLGTPLSMASDAESGRAMLHKNWEKYREIMKRDLKWNLDDHDVSVNGDQLVVALESNELMVIELQ